MNMAQNVCILLDGVQIFILTMRMIAICKQLYIGQIQPTAHGSACTDRVKDIGLTGI